MHLTIEKQDLSKLLAKVTAVVEKRNTIPILANVVLSATDTLQARATDLDIEITASAPATVTVQGETTVNAQMLADIVKSLANGALVTLEYADNWLHISAGRFKSKLATMQVRDYPVIATAEYDTEFDIPALELRRVFDKTKFAMSTEEARYYLQGVYLHHADGVMKAVATDGHRLALAEYAGHTAEFPGVIVPRKTVMLIIQAAELGDVSVGVSSTKIKVQAGSTVIVSKVIDGTFPDYTRVIPKQNNNKATVNAAELKAAASRVALVSSERARLVKFDLSAAGLALSVKGSNGDEATDEVAADYDGEPLQIGFNVAYLAEAMAQCNGDEVMIALNGPSDPGVFRPSDDAGVLFVLMPVRV